ncbi:hypothetical protein CBW24_08445 [Pacificitalea manganoxidans]|uniref:2Fe-2S ferredoxin-type domain-containing protein n=1 Tax=Pacificitalea manganoxidans TaxID=1411902 RepID=A0A291LZA4_9RHOB|nr:2Fe-2S iron-sulfur cluster-binding protein [Pacificitalea manganoxidans]ATI42031.1 hypothetical protein CBW24_08445 [Pacificitalea manganoxidans]MDR6309529.1 carbon-monoxide dehydrogenase small subunit [Pacificitalea manganoxidans]
MNITVTLNGLKTRLSGAALDRLVDHLPQKGLTGARRSCGVGRCGACMVLLEDVPVNACLLPLARLDGARITTAEGLGPRADAIIARLATRGAVQCGYCTPGMTVSLVAALEDPERGDAEAVTKRLTGNLCRCSGYAALRDAIHDLCAAAD